MSQRITVIMQRQCKNARYRVHFNSSLFLLPQRPAPALIHLHDAFHHSSPLTLPIKCRMSSKVGSSFNHLPSSTSASRIICSTPASVMANNSYQIRVSGRA